MEDQAASTLGGNLRPTDVGGFSSRSARQRFQRLYADGLVDRDEIRKRVASWIGHARQADSFALRMRLFSEFPMRKRHPE